MKRSGSSTGGIKARGLSPYWIALPPQEIPSDDAPTRQGSSVPADGGEAREPPPLYPDTALSGPRTPQIEPDAAFEVLGPLSDSAAAPPDPEPQEIDPDDGGLSSQSREQISRALFKASKNRALPRSERPRCGARNRNGTLCQAQGLLNIAGKPGRCRLHGGLSTGAKTAEGLERQRQGASESAQRQWAAARAAGRRTLRNPAPEADSLESENAARPPAASAAHMPSATRDRARARHGEAAPVSAADAMPNLNVSAWLEAASESMEKLSKEMKAAREDRLSGRFAAQEEEVMRIARAFEAGGGLRKGKRR